MSDKTNHPTDPATQQKQRYSVLADADVVDQAKKDQAQNQDPATPEPEAEKTPEQEEAEKEAQEKNQEQVNQEQVNKDAEAKEELAKEFMANDKKARDKARKQTSIPPQYQAREPEKPGVLKRLQRAGAVVAAAIGGLLGALKKMLGKVFMAMGGGMLGLKIPGDTGGDSGGGGGDRSNDENNPKSEEPENPDNDNVEAKNPNKRKKIMADHAVEDFFKSNKEYIKTPEDFMQLVNGSDSKSVKELKKTLGAMMKHSAEHEEVGTLERYLTGRIAEHQGIGSAKALAAYDQQKTALDADLAEAVPEVDQKPGAIIIDTKAKPGNDDFFDQPPANKKPGAFIIDPNAIRNNSDNDDFFDPDAANEAAMNDTFGDLGNNGVNLDPSLKELLNEENIEKKLNEAHNEEFANTESGNSTLNGAERYPNVVSDGNQYVQSKGNDQVAANEVANEVSVEAETNKPNEEPNEAHNENEKITPTKPSNPNNPSNNNDLGM